MEEGELPARLFYPSFSPTQSLSLIELSLLTFLEWCFLWVTFSAEEVASPSKKIKIPLLVIHVLFNDIFSIMYLFIFKLLALNLELVFLILSVVSSLFF